MEFRVEAKLFWVVVLRLSELVTMGLVSTQP